MVITILKVTLETVAFVLAIFGLILLPLSPFVVPHAQAIQADEKQPVQAAAYCTERPGVWCN